MKRDPGFDAAILRTFLESLHPKGGATRVQLIGSSELGSPSQSEDGRDADVVLFAPTSDECRKQGWIETAISQAVQMTAPDGVIYVLAPRRFRASVRRMLQRHGLSIGSPVMHLASGGARYFVPLAGAPLQYALLTWPMPGRWRQICRLIRMMPSSAALLAIVLRHVGFAASKPGSRPFEWFLSRLPELRPGHVIFASSWRGTQSPAVLLAFAARASGPSLIGKQYTDSTRAQREREASNLTRLAPSARETGMAVPELIDDADGAGWMLETAVAGRPMSRALAGRPGELASIVDDLTKWLDRWHRSTLQWSELTPERLEQEVLAPAKMLSGTMDTSQDYVAWLTTTAGNLLGRKVPLVSAHRDLTMANLLRDADRHMGLVDWEEARPVGLPLADFWYAACDAVAAIDEYRNRPAAFHSCFIANGPHRKLIRSHEQALRKSVEGPPAWIEMCFHGCWLQHAANEHLRRDTAERPFLAIVNALSQPALRTSRYA